MHRRHRRQKTMNVRCRPNKGAVLTKKPAMKDAAPPPPVKGKGKGKGKGKDTSEKAIKVDLRKIMTNKNTRDVTREAFGCRVWSMGQKKAKEQGADDAVIKATRSACRAEMIEFWDKCH